MTRQQKYLAYLIRVWRVEMHAERVWRASLEDPHTGERTGFASLAEAVAFLMGRMERAGDDDGRADGGPAPNGTAD